MRHVRTPRANSNSDSNSKDRFPGGPAISGRRLIGHKELKDEGSKGRCLDELTNGLIE
jgi:hypothetical protein